MAFIYQTGLVFDKKRNLARKGYGWNLSFWFFSVGRKRIAYSVTQHLDTHQKAESDVSCPMRTVG